jgi:hypothetical protein
MTIIAYTCLRRVLWVHHLGLHRKRVLHLSATQASALLFKDFLPYLPLPLA